MSTPDVRRAFALAGLNLANHIDVLGPTRPERLGLLEEARAAIDDSLPPAYAAWADYLLSVELVRLGELERAREILEVSLGGAALGTGYEFPVRHLLVEILRKQTHWQEALDSLALFEQALDRRSAAVGESDPQLLLWQARLEGSRGLIEQGLGRLDMALRAHRREAELAERSGDRFARVAHRLNRCDLALLTEDYSSIESSLAQFHQDPLYAELDPQHLAQFGLFLGLAQSELEREDPTRPKRALETLGLVRADSYLPAPEEVVLDRALADLALRAKDYDQARLCLDRLRENQVVGEADRILAMTLEARWALDQGLESAEIERTRRDLEALWPAFLAQWDRTPLAPGGVGFLHHSERREVLSTLIRLSLATHPGRTGVEQALSWVLQAQAMGTEARRSGLVAPGLGALREEWLAEDQGALVYLPCRERTHLFAFDRRGAWHAELDPWDTYKGTLFDLLARLRQDPRRAPDAGARAAELDRLAAALSLHLLPASLEARLRAWKAVTVLGTDHLAGLPASILRFPDGAWLGEELACGVVGSLPMALELARRTRPRAPSSLALFASLDPGSQARATWKGLEVVELEASRLDPLVAPFPATSRRVALGEQATRRAVLETDFSGVDLVHFLVHGVFVSDRERGAALALSAGDGPPQLLTCEDVEELRLSGVVLLSACAAARGPGRPGDDHLAHLGGAFLRAGARAVVLAQAPVELGATVGLMGEVQRGLVQGRSPAEALRSALARARADGGPMAPYRVVQFGVLGDGQRGAPGTGAR